MSPAGTTVWPEVVGYERGRWWAMLPVRCLDQVRCPPTVVVEVVR